MKKWATPLAILTLAYLIKFMALLLGDQKYLFYVIRQYGIVILPILLIIVLFRHMLLIRHHKLISSYLYFSIVAILFIEGELVHYSLPRQDFYKFLLPIGLLFFFFLCFDFLSKEQVDENTIVSNINDLKNLNITNKINQLELLLDTNSLSESGKNDFAQIKFRYKELILSNNRGILFFIEYMVEQNRIHYSLLSFIDSNKDFIKFPITETSKS